MSGGDRLVEPEYVASRRPAKGVRRLVRLLWGTDPAGSSQLELARNRMASAMGGKTGANSGGG